MQSTLKIIEKVAEKLKGKISFAYSNGVEYKEQLTSMGGDGSKLPAIAAMNMEKRHNYPYFGELNEAALIKFHEGIISGEVKPFLKSDPIPESNDGPVTIVVGKNFDAIVMDETKDVLLEFYAPWCTHCKSLEPKYNNVGNFFKKVKTLVIAKVDATTNDTPIAIEGFPTLFFFPKGGKTSPVSFDGDRSEESIIEFLKKNAVASKDELSKMKYTEEKKDKSKKDEL